MATSLIPYLNFAGNTREAFTFYQSVFGGQLVIATFAEFHMTDAPNPDGVMHAELRTDSFTIMASDAMAGAEDSWKGTRVYCSFMSDGRDGDAEKLPQWFDALAEGGHVGQALEKQVWGDLYGNLTDRFGIEWMFNVAQPQGWAQTDH